MKLRAELMRLKLVYEWFVSKILHISDAFEYSTEIISELNLYKEAFFNCEEFYLAESSSKNNDNNKEKLKKKFIATKFMLSRRLLKVSYRGNKANAFSRSFISSILSCVRSAFLN